MCMNSPKYNNKARLVIFNVNINYSNLNTKLISIILLRLYKSLLSKNELRYNSSIIAVKASLYTHIINPNKNLPRLENSLNFINSINNVKILESAYFTLFSFFYNLGRSNHKIFFFDNAGCFNQIASVINWILYSSSDYRSVKLNNLTYKQFFDKKFIKSIPNGISCIVMLPSASSTLKRLVQSLKSPYIVHTSKDYSHRGGNYLPSLLPKHILLLSHLFFFYKKGLMYYNKKKLYKLLLILFS